MVLGILRSPYQEFQRFKMHPRIKALLEAGNWCRCGLSYRFWEFSIPEELVLKDSTSWRWVELPFNSQGGTCISYGARCLNEGGLQAVPKLTFPGGMLTGWRLGWSSHAANVPKISSVCFHQLKRNYILPSEPFFLGSLSQVWDAVKFVFCFACRFSKWNWELTTNQWGHRLALSKDLPKLSTRPLNSILYLRNKALKFVLQVAVQDF